MTAFHVQRIDRSGVIDVGEDLDGFSSPAFEKTITRAESENDHIVVSLERCAYCDSTALAVLIRAKKRLGDRLLIIVPKDVSVRRIFEITDLIDVLGVLERIPDTLRASP